MTHYTISLKENYEKAVQEIIEKAQSESNIVVINKKDLGYNIIFCSDSEIASWTKEGIKKGNSISPSNCVLEIDKYGIHINEECGDESHKHLDIFIKWILNKFHPYQIFNHDDSENNIKNK